MRTGRRVLMTADAVGGVWDYACELGAGLVRVGDTVTLAVMGPGPTAAQTDAARALGLAVEHEPFRLEWMDDPWTDVDRATAWLCALAQRHRVDLVHLNGYSHAVAPFGRPTVVVAHSCVCSWNEAVHGHPGYLHSRGEYRRRIAAGLAAATCIVAPTRFMREAVKSHYAPSAPIVVISNGRDPNDYAAQSKQPLVLSAGRLWDDAKNVMQLVRVALRLPWPLHLAGAVAQNGSDPGARPFPGVELLGRLDRKNMADAMARATIFALPARYEPFGLSILEAALSGCALVIGDTPSLRELWQGAADLVDPDDDRALFQTLLRLIGDDAHRRRQAEAALHRARQYTAARMVDGYLQVYAALCPAADKSTPQAEAAACA